ncbi:hypothetical protein HPB47_017826 [Ixodes persulcatus]|uniref:Uncharacterized protein n=1 Tax=Ixodes persulcatus TaxID=34615 RepID=A0AC60QPA4_IXOPE|nr:hypothetical protein HPB47_017826 [Ixodes persulcatus]
MLALRFPLLQVFRTTLLSTLLSTAPRTLRGATTTIDGGTPEPEALNKTSTYHPAFFAATISPGTDAHPLLSAQPWSSIRGAGPLDWLPPNRHSRHDTALGMLALRFPLLQVFRTTLLSTLLSTAPRTLRGATTTIDGGTSESRERPG